MLYSLLKKKLSWDSDFGSFVVKRGGDGDKGDIFEYARYNAMMEGK